MFRKVLASSLTTLLIGACGLAQTNLETNAGIQFNFSTPGAGNLALGGAFLALADDPSAAYTNPAGLINLAEDQILIEVRDWGYTHVFTDRGRLEGRPTTGQGIDTIEGLRSGEASDSVAGLSFLAYVYPRKKWSLALYRHTLADFEANFSTQGAFLEPTRSRNPVSGFPIFSDGRLASLQNSMSLEIVNHGIAAAYRLGQDFSLGASLTYYDFSIKSTTNRFLPNLLEAPDFDHGNVTAIQTQSGSDSGWGASLGFLWKMGPDWSLGGVFRQGPEFSFSALSEPGVAAHPVLESAGESDQQASFRIPRVIGIGISFNPMDELRISLDYNHIEYSALIEDIVDIFDVQRAFSRNPDLEGFKMDDVGEIHLGVEYFLETKVPLFLRLGAWIEPDHSLRYEGDNVGLQAVYRPQGDQMHYTFGVGLLRGKYRFDVAVDYSERTAIGAASIGFRF